MIFQNSLLLSKRINYDGRKTNTGTTGYNESESQNTSESISENKGANTSKSETTSTGGTRNVVVWPKYDEKGNLEHLYMVILNGDYKNISMEFRRE